MKIKWKKVKHLAPHCGVCGEEFTGNNSDMFPYKCKCGTWKNNYKSPCEYELVEEK